MQRLRCTHRNRYHEDMTHLAWHNSPDLKAEVITRLRQHRTEDSIVKGRYQELDPHVASGYRGCAIGCTLPHLDQDPASWHARVEELYGIPRTVAWLIDGIFENLPTVDDAHATFAVGVIDAVPVGADLSLVTARMMLDLLADPDSGVVRYTESGSRQRTAVDTVIALYRRQLDGEEITREEWTDYAADAAADAAYAAYAAYAVDYAAAAAAYAAYAVDYAADASVQIGRASCRERV